MARENRVNTILIRNGDVVDEELYFVWVDQISGRGDQLQSHSHSRASLASIGIDPAILFLCGGLAAGLLSRYGEMLADGSVGFLRWLAGRRHREVADPELTGPAGSESDVASASVNLVVEIIVAADLQDFAEATLIGDLIELGFEKEVARMLATKMLPQRRPSPK
jgi:hypothetical protein